MTWPQPTQNWNASQAPPNSGFHPHTQQFGGQAQGPPSWSHPGQSFDTHTTHSQYAATTGVQQSPPQQQWPSAQHSSTTPFPSQGNGGQHAPTTSWPQGRRQQQQQNGSNPAAFSNANAWGNTQQFGQPAPPPPQQQPPQPQQPQQQWHIGSVSTWPQPTAQQPPQQQQSAWPAPQNGSAGATTWPTATPTSNNPPPAHTNNPGWTSSKGLSRFGRQALPTAGAFAETSTSNGWVADARDKRAAMCARAGQC